MPHILLTLPYLSSKLKSHVSTSYWPNQNHSQNLSYKRGSSLYSIGKYTPKRLGWLVNEPAPSFLHILCGKPNFSPYDIHP